MPGGTFGALTGMRARLEALDRIAFDLANVSTPGYKTERVATRSIARGDFETMLDSSVDVVVSGAKIDFSPGTIATTGRDLDVAIDGRGFFEIETERGLRYTRNGSFHRRNDGLLTTAAGEPVLGEDGTLTVPPGPVTVSTDGTIQSGGKVVGRLRVVEFKAESDLVRESGARFKAIAGARPEDVEPRVIGGSLEESNVSVVDCMATLTELSRGFEALQRGAYTLSNDLDARAISELARR